MSARSNAMHLDARGLPLSTASPKAAAAFDHLVTGYLTFRVDTPDRLNAVLEADPDFALAHCMKGYFAMLAFKQAVVPVAVEAARTAQSLAAGATPRERSHIAAATAWAEGELELAPGDLWAAHAVAHVMEMQGRRSEGIQWLTTLAPHWEGAHNLQHHLWWHCALFMLEHGDRAAVLELYDTRFRNLAGPLTVASPDVYIDVQNSASMLFRLQRLGVDVGNRWEELADKAEARIGDCQSAFTLPHWLMALTATGRTAAADRMTEAMRALAHGRGTVPPLVRDYVLPIADAQP